MTRLFLGVLALVLLLSRPATADTVASDRVALVIGMSAYQSIPSLANTLNDADAFALTLESIGFEVRVLNNGTREQLMQALQDFAFLAETADLALIYFAGHGVSVQGSTFLIPVDAKVSVAKDIVATTVTMDTMLSAADRARKMSILILDSCRDNPFPDLIDLRDPEVVKGLTTGKGGLAEPSPERGSLVAFATRPGDVALDGSGTNSPFNEALRRNIVVADLEISLMFRKVRDDVLEMTDNLQEPATYGSLPGEPFFLTGDNSDTGSMGVEQLAAEWSKIAEDNQEQLETMALAGDTRSMMGLAIGKLDGTSAIYDPKGAADLLSQAATTGDPEAKYRLAKLYEKGFGVPLDSEKALALFMESAAEEYPAAVNDLGYFHYFGELGVAKDAEAALQLFRKAAELGHTEAMFNVASFAAHGKAPGMDARDAAELLYGALRGGSTLALDGLLQNPDKFPVETWKALQQILADNGLYDGGIDGEFGPGTRRSVKAAFGIFEAGN